MTSPTYDPRFDYSGDRPRFADPEERDRWIAAREKLCKAQSWKCYYCGSPLKIHFMHMDHKQPRSRNGSDHPLNLCMTCQTCNLKKGDLTEIEFRVHYGLPVLPEHEPKPEHFKPGHVWVKPALTECPLEQGAIITHKVLGQGFVIATHKTDDDIVIDIKFENYKSVKRISWAVAASLIAVLGEGR